MTELYLFVALLFVILFIVLLIRGFKMIAAAQKSDWGKTSLNYLDGLNRLFCQHYHRLQYTPIALPNEGPAIVVANHISGLDALLMIATASRPLRFLIAREQYERFGLYWLFKAIGCIPVDRSHHPETALRAALRVLEDGEVLALFPQGKMVFPGESHKLKRGSLWLAQQTQCPIYPVFISGIKGVGSIFLSIVQRNHAKLETYPSFYWHQDKSLHALQAILEGRSPQP
jgi:1-acyl-sn-glycerol-3-phosphate acyltransferase